MRQQHEEQEEPEPSYSAPAYISPEAQEVEAETVAVASTSRAFEPNAASEESLATAGQTQLKTKLRAKRAKRSLRLLHPDPRRAVLTGIFAANGLALALMLLTRWMSSLWSDVGGVFAMGDFVLLPMAMGGICAYFWQEAKLSKAAYLLYGLMNTGLALLLSYVFLREGTICLLMASPLILIFVLLGSFIGRQIFAAKHAPLNASLAPLLLTLFVADSLSPHHFANQESDTIVIHAPPAQVWKYIIAYPANTAPPDYWLFRCGLPAPIQSTADGQRVGATRRCIFTGNVAFEEKLTVVEPGKRLEFDVTSQPNHPEIVGHFTLQKGRFRLKDNGDGTTTLTGTTWYQLRVYPICYYDRWTQDILRHVHLRVMRHIEKQVLGIRD